MSLLYLFLQKLSVKDLTYLRRLLNGVLASKVSHNKKVRSLWDQKGYLRNLYETPSNPSRGDLRLYKKFLGDGKGKKALLLGSTPLLRSLLNKLNFKNYVIADFSHAAFKSSIEILDMLSIDVDRDNEIWIKSDWLNMPLVPKSFDYIIGDFVFTQIEPSRQVLFSNKILSLLKNDGIFVSRMHFRNPEWDNVTSQQIIKEILDTKSSESLENLRSILLYGLRNKLRDRKTQMTYPSVIIDELVRYKASDKNEIKLLNSVKELLSVRVHGRLPFVTQDKEEFEKMLSGKFFIKESKHALDYTSKYFPVYVLGVFEK